MPSKSHRRHKRHSKHVSKKRNARGKETDELEQAEKGQLRHSKPKTPPPRVPFHKVTAPPAPNLVETILARPVGFDPNALDEAALKAAESKMYKPKGPTPPVLARIPTDEFFNFPPPEERERLRREASEELKAAEARALAETNLAAAQEDAAKMVESNKVVPDKKRSLLNRFGLGKKSRKGKKHKKGKKHSTRRK